MRFAENQAECDQSVLSEIEGEATIVESSSSLEKV